MVSRKNLDGDDEYGDTGDDLVKEPDEDDVVACSPLNAGEEKGDEEENIREILSEPGKEMMMMMTMMTMMTIAATGRRI